ncbi:MAG: GGDEF domain-containing protein [Firmicutes bacterium]|nr:GGDEF domain-containing protein [Bacillota bacterium]
MRITKKVFTDLAIWMMGFGMLVGVAFPFIIILMGVPAEITLNVLFFAMCITAGLIVGVVNIVLAKKVVGKRLKKLTDRMCHVENHINTVLKTDDFNCTPENCYIDVDSEDVLGDNAKAFNSLVDTLSVSLKTEIAIRRYTEMLTSHLNINDLANRALQQLVSISKANAGAILIDMSGALNLLTSTGIVMPETLTDNPFINDVLRNEKRANIKLPADINLDGVIAEFRPKEVIVEPIKYKQVPLGVILLSSVEEFPAETHSSLDLFSQSLALALNNALTHDQTQKLAAIDPLTNIYNRRFGLIRLHEEYIRAVRHQSGLGVMMIDIDDFKIINDTFGHCVGDKVVYHIAKVIRSAIREGDIVMRYGGEEFICVITGASLEDTNKVAEKIHRMVKDSVIKHGHQTIKSTISIGLTSYPEHDASNEQDLIEYADKALYTAKDMGKDKVITYN